MGILILSFLSPWIGELLKECEEQGRDTEFSLILPHVEEESISNFLSNLLNHEVEGQVDTKTLHEIFPSIKPCEQLKKERVCKDMTNLSEMLETRLGEKDAETINRFFSSLLDNEAIVQTGKTSLQPFLFSP